MKASSAWSWVPLPACLHFCYVGSLIIDIGLYGSYKLVLTVVVPRGGLGMPKLLTFL